MEIKTIELSGAALDWAVAKAEGKAPKIQCTSFQSEFIYRVYLGWSYEHHSSGSIVEYNPSKDWSISGPIIEREKLTLVHTSETLLSGKPIEWVAVHPDRYVEFDADGDVSEWHLPDAYGPTLLIAAMRCYVASKLGNEIEIPKELIK